MEVKSVLRIGSAHNKRGSPDLKIVGFPHFSDFSELKLWFIFIYEHIANQNSVRFSVSVTFYKFRSSKCKQSVCLHYGLDFYFKENVLDFRTFCQLNTGGEVVKLLDFHL